MRDVRVWAGIAAGLLITASCGTQTAVEPVVPPSPSTTKSVSPTVLAATVVPTTEVVSTTMATAAAAPTAPPPPAPPAPNPCSAVDFNNFTYYLPGYEIVKVANGLGERNSPGDKYYVAVQIRDTATGDIGGTNGDAETVVFVDASVGTDERVSDVHVMTCSPRAVTIVASAGGGDRAYGGVRAIAIQNQKLLVDRYADDNGVCCPGAATRTIYSLVDKKLVADEKPVTRKLTVLDGKAPVALGFLFNSSSAVVMGETGKAQRGGFNAFTNQNISLKVEPAGPDQGTVIIDVLLNTTVLGSVSSGDTKQFKLPQDGYYELLARPAKPDVFGRFDAELTVG